MQCSFIKINHQQCRAQALRGKKLCFTHNPESIGQRKQAHRNGGLARRHYEFYSQPIELKQPQDIQKLMEIAINGVLNGKIPASQPANTLGFLARCWLDAYEKGELKERVDKIEVKITNYDYVGNKN